MRPHLLLAGCLVTSLLTAAGVAPAQQAPAAAPAKAAATAAKPATNPPLPAAKPVAGAARPAARAARKKKGKEAPITGPIATYPGFRMLDGGGSRVFVTLSKKVNVTEQKAEGKVTYRIQGVQVPTRTNRLPLLTAFFSTPVSRVELKTHDSDVDLVIDLRATTTPQFRIIETDKGAELQVDFPKAASETEATGEAPAATTRPATAKSLDNKAETVNKSETAY